MQLMVSVKMQHLLCVSNPLWLLDRTRAQSSLIFSINFSDVSPKLAKFTLGLLSFVCPPLPYLVVNSFSDSMRQYDSTR